jgi:hypothetical protein
MRSLSLASLLFLAVTPACHDHADESDVIRVNDASDEVFVTLEDLDAQGAVMVDDAEAATLTAPASGATLSGDTPPTFTWALPAQTRTPRHGVANGTFYWLRFTGAGISGQVDVLAVAVLTWTPTAEDWARISAGTEVTVRLVTAIVDDALVVEGPWRPTANPSFTIQ